MTPGTTRAVFLSYRREETRHIAGRLADRLINRLGSTQVFMDVDAVEPGVDFAAAIAREVTSCDVLIALIGPTWSTIADRQGRRRLDDPDDFVVLEIRAALEREIRVIPVLVDGAVMPDQYDLPNGLQGLVRRNAVRLDHETFHSDVTTLLDAVERILPILEKVTAPTVETSTRATYRAINKEHADQAAEANNFGLQLAEQGDVAGARAAYQRAIYSGHADQAPLALTNLGALFAEQGDVADARAAYRQAIDSGHAEWAPKAAFNLGVLFAEQGDVAGARAAYRQAIDSGHAEWAPKAAFNLGVLLSGRRDLIIEALSVLRNKSGVYFSPDFPTDDRLKRVREAANIPSHEQIVVLVDLSLTSSGKAALIFGVDGIYYRNIGSSISVDYVTMSRLGDAVIHKGWNSRMRIGDTSFLIGGIKFERYLLGSAIRTLQARLRKRSF